jgi:hypothetical protein
MVAPVAVILETVTLEIITTAEARTTLILSGLVADSFVGVVESCTLTVKL